MANDLLLLPGEVAEVFRVDPKTVTRWAGAGRISKIRTPGGHGRYRLSDVRALLTKEGATEDEANELLAAVVRKRQAARSGR